LEGGKKMEMIKLQDVAELKDRESLPDVPEFAQRYFDTEDKERRTEGKYFRITIEEESRPESGAGIAYLNALNIEKRNGKSWDRVYSTGMIQYRGAYNYEVDDWDLSLGCPTIFEESKSEVIYALCTGAGNVKMYRFSVGEGQAEPLAAFNVYNYGKTKRRIELLSDVVNDAKAFQSYIEESLGNRWSIRNSETLADGKIIVLLARHSDRDYDAITDRYQIHVWVKGKGVGNTEQFFTGLRHPAGKFYYVGVDFSVKLVAVGKNFSEITATIYNRTQQWEAKHDLRIG